MTAILLLIYDDVERVLALLVGTLRSFERRVRVVSLIQVFKSTTVFSFRLSFNCTFTHGPRHFEHWVLIDIQIGLRANYSAELLIPIESCHRCLFGHRWLADPITRHLSFVKFHLVQLIFRLFIYRGELLVSGPTHLNMLARIVDRVHV